jgi:hypothetical protein
VDGSIRDGKRRVSCGVAVFCVVWYEAAEPVWREEGDGVACIHIAQGCKSPAEGQGVDGGSGVVFICERL